MSNWHGNGETPRMGFKIFYGVSAKKFDTAVYGSYWEFDPNNFEVSGEGLSDYTPWKYVIMWKYIDEFYNYGRGLDKRSEG